jgi:hypothetical protein
MGLKIRQPELTERDQERLVNWYKSHISIDTYKEDTKLIEKLLGKTIKEIIK